LIEAAFAQIGVLKQIVGVTNLEKQEVSPRDKKRKGADDEKCEREL
jgi:hypothetical protein